MVLFLQRAPASCRHLVHVSLSPMDRFPADVLTLSVCLKGWLLQVASQKTETEHGYSKSYTAYVGFVEEAFPTHGHVLFLPALRSAQVIYAIRQSWQRSQWCVSVKRYETTDMKHWISYSFKISTHFLKLTSGRKFSRHDTNSLPKILHFFLLWFWANLTFL